jgi:glycosyltransferase involved in cell wall biosynthesis
MPKITVITPTHRRPDLLFQCIKAVQKSSFNDCVSRYNIKT